MQKQKHYTGRKLHKINEGKSVAGVCTGLAHYFNIDVTVVRLLFVLFTLAGGPGLIVYIALAIVMPGGNDNYNDNNDDWV